MRIFDSYAEIFGTLLAVIAFVIAIWDLRVDRKDYRQDNYYGDGENAKKVAQKAGETGEEKGTER